MRDGYFFVLDADSGTSDDEEIYQFDTGAVINIFDDGSVVKDGTVVTVQEDPTLGGLSVEFEFDSDDPAAVGAGRVAVPFDNGAAGAATTNITLASRLAAAINAANNLDVVATAVGGRVTLVNDNAVQITHPTGTAGLQLEGARGVAPMIQITDVSQLVDGDQILVNSSNGSGSHIFEFDNDANTTAGSSPVTFNVADSSEDVAAAISAAVTSTFQTTGLQGHAGGSRVVIMARLTLVLPVFQIQRCIWKWRAQRRGRFSRSLLRRTGTQSRLL